MATMVASKKTSGHSRSLSGGGGEFSFATQSHFNAGQDLVLTRSDSYVVREPAKLVDIWDRPPPDFRPQQYLPKPPKRNSRESMQPWKYGTFPGQAKTLAKTEKKKKTVELPKILQPVRPRSGQLVTRFKIKDPHESRVEFVREGMFPREKYQMPKKHDFRGYPPLGPLGLPEFITASDPDPYNLRFKNENRDIIVGLPQPRSERSEGLQMGLQAISPRPKYQPELIMPSLKWPTTSGEFTRFRRRNRSPHTVLLDQIEGTLEEGWRRDSERQEQIRQEMERDKRERQFREEVARRLAARTQAASASTIRTQSEVRQSGNGLCGRPASYAASAEGIGSRGDGRGQSDEYRSEDSHSGPGLGFGDESDVDMS